VAAAAASPVDSDDTEARVRVEGLLQRLGEAAQAGAGERLCHTACLACACGHAQTARFILDGWKPALTSAQSDGELG
jgi:hypothetical protein